MFWERVDKSGGPDACWPYMGARNRTGYGVVTRRPANPYLAHRYAWFLTYGRWPEPCGLHLCDNPPCCNPAHLFEGDRAANNRDMAAKGRHVGRRGQHHTAEHRQKLRELFARRRAQAVYCANGHPWSGNEGFYQRVSTGRRDRYCMECARLNAAVQRAKIAGRATRALPSVSA